MWEEEQIWEFGSQCAAVSHDVFRPKLNMYLSDLTNQVVSLLTQLRIHHEVFL